MTMPRSSIAFLRAAACILAAAGFVVGSGAPAGAERTPTGVQYHRIIFPVIGNVRYTDDFGDCRGVNCSRHHEGNDLMGAKLMREVAASSGTIAWVHTDSSGNAGNMLSLIGNDGWEYWYIHINNDTPGTDDGKNPARWRFAPGLQAGTKVKAGQFIAYMGDSGDAENTQAHLHFEIHTPNGTPIDPYTSLRLSQGLAAGGQCGAPSNPPSHPSLQGGTGYWTLDATGRVLGFGSAHTFGSAQVATGGHAVALSPTTSGRGYWITDSRGAIDSFGDAHPLGSTAGMHLNAPVIGMTTTPTGKGYWLLARDGGVFTFGDAKFAGSTGAMHLNAPIIAMAATGTGKGYWLLGADGGVFTFGDAKFFGSTGAMKLNAPVVGMGTAAGGGYWLLGADGGMFSFGHATYYGSLPGTGACAGSNTAVAFTGTNTGRGYWVVLSDGRVLPFGDAEHFGDAPANARPVSFAVKR
ncbi:MAG: hypothetical protein QOG50_671 [Actinomycetota bacterium]|nr:hypothetical protein [Actinomycetota bacterium]